jgi:hypothetical protein
MISLKKNLFRIIPWISCLNIKTQHVLKTRKVQLETLKIPFSKIDSISGLVFKFEHRVRYHTRSTISAHVCQIILNIPFLKIEYFQIFQKKVSFSFSKNCSLKISGFLKIIQFVHYNLCTSTLVPWITKYVVDPNSINCVRKLWGRLPQTFPNFLAYTLRLPPLRPGTFKLRDTLGSRPSPMKLLLVVSFHCNKVRQVSVRY